MARSNRRARACAATFNYFNTATERIGPAVSQLILKSTLKRHGVLPLVLSAVFRVNQAAEETMPTGKERAVAGRGVVDLILPCHGSGTSLAAGHSGNHSINSITGPVDMQT